MRESIIFAPGANGTELLRSLALYDISTIGVRITGSSELASIAMTRSGRVSGRSFISYREQAGIIYSLLTENRIPYFDSASYKDAENIAASLNGLRRLIPENEASGVERVLSLGKFQEKNQALLEIYRLYTGYCEDKQLADSIAMVREAIESVSPLPCDFTTLAEFPLTPLDRRLLEVVSAEPCREMSLTELFHAEDRPLHIEEYVSAYGATNEVENIIGDIYSSGRPLDKCVVAVTDTLTYGQFFYDISQTFGIPVTFGCGIPILNTNPARLLKQLMKWQGEGCCGFDALYELTRAPFFDRKKLMEYFEDFEDPFKALAIGLKMAGNLRLGFDPDVNESRTAAFRATLAENSEDIRILDATAAFFRDFGKGYINAIRNYSVIRPLPAGLLDREAVGTICDSIQIYTTYLTENGMSEESMLESILQKTVRSEASAEGCLHVCGIGSALSTVRENLYVAGLSADTFPGRSRENYLLLDSDYAGLEADAPSSERIIQNRLTALDNLLSLYSDLGNRCVLSYPHFSHSVLKEMNASSALLKYFREEHGRGIKPEDFSRADFFRHVFSPLSGIGRAYLDGRDAAFNPADTRSDGVSYDYEREYSPTAVETYLGCPRRFYLQYVLKIPQPETDDPYTVIDPRTRGNLAHALFESLQPDTDRNEFLSRCERAFDGFILSRPAVIASSADAAKEDFMEMMEYGYSTDPRNEPVASEEDIHARHPAGVNVHGFPDRVERTPDGKYIIVDYKTGGSVQHVDNDIDSCFQAVVYAWLIETEKGYPVDHCEFRYPRAKQVVTCRYDDEMREALAQRLAYFRAGMQSGNFAPCEKCDKFCKFTSICKKAREEARLYDGSDDSDE